MLRSTGLLALLGAVSKTLACEIPSTPLGNNITEGFSIFVQNASIPAVHNRIMNFRPNGFDKHLVLRPEGEPTYDLLVLQNGYLIYKDPTFQDRRAVIDLEHNPADDTTKMFMTDRTYPYATFQAVYGCDPDTDELQTILQLVSRQTTPPVFGGAIGIQTAGPTYEFRYTPPDNPLLDARFMHVNMVIFRDGIVPPQPSTTTTAAPTPTLPPTNPSTIGDYDYVSCWAEPDGGRTLPTVTTAADMTNEKCALACGGSQYFGTQWSVECWCGPSLAAGSAAAPEGDCSNTCGGNSTEACGGGRRLSLYKLKPAAGGSSTTTSSRTTSIPTTTAPTTTAPTTTTRTTTAPTTTSSHTTSSGTASSSAATSSTSSSPSTGPTDTAKIGAFNFVSCYAEPSDGRALPDAGFSSGTMTNQACADFCSDYAYFGTEWNRECYCGLALTPGSAIAPASDCASFPCTGDPTQRCGGSRRLSLYHNPDWTGFPVPPNVGGYKWYGCVTDSIGVRTLTAKSLWSATMTLETCAAYCGGYKYFGTEYSTECYCGNTFTTGAEEVDIRQCSMTCAGDATEKCGAGARMSVYEVITT